MSVSAQQWDEVDNKFVDCMVFKAVCNNNLVLSWRQMHLSMLSSSALHSILSGEREMKPITMTIINPQKYIPYFS